MFHIQLPKLNRKGESATDKIIGLSIALFVFVAIGILALQNLANADTTNLTTTEIALIGLVGIMFVLMVVYAFYKHVSD